MVCAEKLSAVSFDITITSNLPCSAFDIISVGS
jgi:hypothetical protein